MERLFIELCKKGDLRGAKREYQLNPNMNISAFEEQAFCYACEYGRLRVARWLLQISQEKGQSIDISAKNEYAFRYACENGHLHMAQWLLQVSKKRGHDINISIFNELAFRMACKNGHLEVAQWLLQIKQDINISADNEYAFWWSCYYEKLHVAQWLQQMKPYLYVIEYDEKGNMKDYRIRIKEEANWQKRKYLVWLASNHCPDKNKNNLLYKLPSDVSRMIIGFV